LLEEDELRELPREEVVLVWGLVMRTLLSVIVPCYNERSTLAQCVERVLAIQSDDLALDIIIVDDCSRDGSLALAKELLEQHSQITILCHSVNKGKGAALRTGIVAAKGDFVTFQDADLEYDPQDFKRMLVPLKQDEADVVYGSRFSRDIKNRCAYRWQGSANRFLTALSNFSSGLKLQDMETCYKMFRREDIAKIEITENGFAVEPELTAEIARLRCNGSTPRIVEVGIHYNGRSYDQGKKIGFKDAIRSIYAILKYNFFG
jgi:dolichol-phosphate mannosyltransferase